MGLPLLDFLVDRGEIRDYDTDGDDHVRVWVRGHGYGSGEDTQVLWFATSRYALLPALLRAGVIGAYELEENMTMFVRGVADEGEETWAIWLSEHGEVIA